MSANSRRRALLEVVARAIPGAVVETTSVGTPVVAVRRAGVPTTYSVTWYNYPEEAPYTLKVYSHHGDFAAPKSVRREYLAYSVREAARAIDDLIHLAKPAIATLEGVELVSRIFDEQHQEGDEVITDQEKSAHLLADLIEYCEARSIPFDDVLVQAKQFFH